MSRKPGYGDLPQILSFAFLAHFSGIIQLKSTLSGTVRITGNMYLIVYKVGVTHAYVKKMKSSLEALL